MSNFSSRQDNSTEVITKILLENDGLSERIDGVSKISCLSEPVVIKTEAPFRPDNGEIKTQSSPLKGNTDAMKIEHPT